MTTISSTVKEYPKHAYKKIAEGVLGTKYDLSLVFVGEDRAQSLNKKYRKKTYIPNVLSFPLDKVSGEIYICPKVAKREAHKFSMTYRQYVGYLFIHGLLHLKGYDHGGTMERKERALMRSYIT
ncbi:rRNA maturation RNase YbeY [Candidatus Kaiserbacteria bacterium]|nr:rRNA maturation RNase YbeY [Candidatus Kaiserbacteria bacterium]